MKPEKNPKAQNKKAHKNQTIPATTRRNPRPASTLKSAPCITKKLTIPPNFYSAMPRISSPKTRQNPRHGTIGFHASVKLTAKSKIG
jgi:hypothetical protein